jgi:hypothetical protein
MAFSFHGSERSILLNYSQHSEENFILTDYSAAILIPFPYITTPFQMYVIGPQRRCIFFMIYLTTGTG